MDSDNRKRDGRSNSLDPNRVIAHTARFEAVKKPPEVKRSRRRGGDVVIGEDGLFEDGAGKKKKNKSGSGRRAWEIVKKIWRKISPPLAFICAVIIVWFIVKFAAGFIIDKYVKPVDPSDPTPITVVIPRGSGASAVAKILYEAGGEGEKGLIQNKAIFKVYVDFKGKSSSLKAGKYVLSRNMSLKQIVDTLCNGSISQQTVKFTISEGMTCEGIAAKLVDLGILQSEEKFLRLCENGKTFAGKYWFIKTISDEGKPDRPYILEGYLFPDTYEIFTDADEEDIITKMLDRFNDIYTRTYAERAEELGMSLDEIVVLASIIEKEAKPFDFAKVSSVFHERLRLNMTLGSDATLGYILKTNSIEFSQSELETDSPYNTYRFQGLPAGPISNPGKAALEAALYPNEQYIKDGYLYFCLMDSATGALVFAKTAEEHAANVAKYRPYW